MSRNLHVVQISPFADPQGRDPEELLEAWPTLVEVAGAAAADGVSVTVVQAGSREASFERNGASIRFVSASRPGPLRRRLGLWAHPVPSTVVRTVGRLEPDLLHTHSLSFPRFFTRVRERLPHTPILVQDHGDGIPGARIRWLHRRAYRTGVDAVAFTAREQAEPWIEAGILPRELPVHEVLESSSRFRPGDREAARDRTGLRGDPGLLWVGRLNADKDPLTVLAAVEGVARALPGVRLWCCFTEAPLRERVEDRIGRSPLLRDRVHLLGRVSHGRVELLLRAADFLVSGSRREGSGYAVLESMACGTAPLITDIPPHRRITDGGRFGGLYPPGDPGALEELLQDRCNRDQERTRGEVRRHFETRLSFRAVGSELRDAYREVAASGSEER
ncbi:MAG: glycosyltransferase [Gemmatimonadetes bacterium]|nr:glycosyltransferase family 4 protein [Gemmatimonadota bacterium]NIR77721.1 glycosyltransferase family 4 protein [Gemmatimonadota bacterium]NIT86265.1 glycosyltransferase family 4 protein [Gemmatimonadota bacterium]NIU30091.1 glycosyltransferase family 4 protein [Gemmatimonadota bacterium]NIU35039.1 glycosyltransferase [Gemmatimonadota bacterium]